MAENEAEAGGAAKTDMTAFGKPRAVQAFLGDGTEIHRT